MNPRFPSLFVRVAVACLALAGATYAQTGGGDTPVPAWKAPRTADGQSQLFVAMKF